MMPNNRVTVITRSKATRSQLSAGKPAATKASVKPGVTKKNSRMSGPKKSTVTARSAATKSDAPKIVEPSRTGEENAALLLKKLLPTALMDILNPASAREKLIGVEENESQLRLPGTLDTVQAEKFRSESPLDLRHAEKTKELLDNRTVRQSYTEVPITYGLSRETLPQHVQKIDEPLDYSTASITKQHSEWDEDGTIQGHGHPSVFAFRDRPYTSIPQQERSEYLMPARREIQPSLDSGVLEGFEIPRASSMVTDEQRTTRALPMENNRENEEVSLIRVLPSGQPYEPQRGHRKFEPYVLPSEQPNLEIHCASAAPHSNISGGRQALNDRHFTGKTSLIPLDRYGSSGRYNGNNPVLPEAPLAGRKNLEMFAPQTDIYSGREASDYRLMSWDRYGSLGRYDDGRNVQLSQTSLQGLQNVGTFAPQTEICAGRQASDDRQVTGYASSILSNFNGSSGRYHGGNILLPETSRAQGNRPVALLPVNRHQLRYQPTSAWGRPILQQENYPPQQLKMTGVSQTMMQDRTLECQRQQEEKKMKSQARNAKRRQKRFQTILTVAKEELRQEFQSQAASLNFSNSHGGFSAAAVGPSSQHVSPELITHPLMFPPWAASTYFP